METAFQRDDAVVHAVAYCPQRNCFYTTKVDNAMPATIIEAFGKSVQEGWKKVIPVYDLNVEESKLLGEYSDLYAPVSRFTSAISDLLGSSGVRTGGSVVNAMKIFIRISDSSKDSNAECIPSDSERLVKDTSVSLLDYVSSLATSLGCTDFDKDAMKFKIEIKESVLIDMQQAVGDAKDFKADLVKLDSKINVEEVFDRTRSCVSKGKGGEVLEFVAKLKTMGVEGGTMHTALNDGLCSAIADGKGNEVLEFLAELNTLGVRGETFQTVLNSAFPSAIAKGKGQQVIDFVRVLVGLGYPTTKLQTVLGSGISSAITADNGDRMILFFKAMKDQNCMETPDDLISFCVGHFNRAMFGPNSTETQSDIMLTYFGELSKLCSDQNYISDLARSTLFSEYSEAKMQWAVSFATELTNAGLTKKNILKIFVNVSLRIGIHIQRIINLTVVAHQFQLYDSILAELLTVSDDGQTMKNVGVVISGLI